MVRLMIALRFVYYCFIIKSSNRLWILKATRTASLGDALTVLKRTELLWIWKV